MGGRRHGWWMTLLGLMALFAGALVASLAVEHLSPSDCPSCVPCLPCGDHGGSDVGTHHPSDAWGVTEVPPNPVTVQYIHPEHPRARDVASMEARWSEIHRDAVADSVADELACREWVRDYVRARVMPSVWSMVRYAWEESPGRLCRDAGQQ